MDSILNSNEIIPSTSALIRWTRHGLLRFPWGRFESFEKLVLTPYLRERLIQRTESFKEEERELHALQLPWRYGLFLFGPTGTGKTAASRGIAQRFGWDHLTIPAHEILDSHCLERAISDATSLGRCVVVLEDLDLILRRMEPEVFFTLLDHAMERGEGIFWIGTTRHAEDTPKTQLLRPGRFDESLRMEAPQGELRKMLLAQLLDLPTEEADAQALLGEWVELTHGLTFAHFEELRLIKARAKIEKRDLSETSLQFKAYVEDQWIAGDRLGGLSDETERVKERVNHVDPRVLMAALQMTDVFKLLMEKVIGDASEQAKTDDAHGNQKP